MSNTIAFVIPGPPLPWQRTGQSGVVKYTTPEQRAYQKHVGKIANAALSHIDQWDPKGPFRLTVHVYRLWNRGDLSNFVKQIEDSLNHTGVWDDDRLVHESVSRMFVDKARPRVEVVVERIEREEQKRVNVEGSRAVLGKLKGRVG